MLELSTLGVKCYLFKLILCHFLSVQPWHATYLSVLQCPHALDKVVRIKWVQYMQSAENSVWHVIRTRLVYGIFNHYCHYHYYLSCCSCSLLLLESQSDTALSWLPTSELLFQTFQLILWKLPSVGLKRRRRGTPTPIQQCFLLMSIKTHHYSFQRKVFTNLLLSNTGQSLISLM